MKSINTHDNSAGHLEFVPAMKMSELIETDYRLLPVVERMGISLGFGDSSVAQACSRAGVPSDFFLLVCRIQSEKGFIPDQQQLENIRLADLVSYLHSSHIYFSEIQIPRLRVKLDQMVSTCEDSHAALLKSFFSNYETELSNHFEYEDLNVFPYVRQLSEGKHTEGYSIERFEKNHSNIEEKLSDLKNIILKYLPSTCDPVLRMEVLFDIFRLGEDIGKHTFMENHILIPLVGELEREQN